MNGSGRGFDGPAGVLAAPVMARMNRDMEQAALDAARPGDGMEVVVLGSGPGMGLALLLGRCRPGRVLAVDPSAAMQAAARRRVRSQVRAMSDVVEWLPTTAADLGPAHGHFDLAVAVNSHQLWTPRAESTSAVAHVLRPGSPFVSLTHVWAIEKQMPVARWQGEVDDELAAAGLWVERWSRAPYRSGDGVMVVARRVVTQPTA